MLGSEEMAPETRSGERLDDGLLFLSEMTTESFSLKIQTVEEESKTPLLSPTSKLGEEDVMENERRTKDKNCFGGSLFDANTNEVNEVAELRNLDSQEPGDQSLADALDFVDKLLKFDFGDEIVDVRTATGGKYKQISIKKRVQTLSRKRDSHRDDSNRYGVFDWDNNGEDEGSGIFFNKNKEAHGNTSVDKLLDAKEKFSEELKLSSKNCKSEKGRGDDLNKNLIKDFDEQLNWDSIDSVKVAILDKNVHDIADVGPDTQLAASKSLENDSNKVQDTERLAGFLGEERKLAGQSKKKSKPDSDDLCTLVKSEPLKVSKTDQLETAKTESNLKRSRVSEGAGQRKDGFKSNGIDDYDRSFCIPIAFRTRKSRKLNDDEERKRIIGRKRDRSGDDRTTTLTQKIENRVKLADKEASFSILRSSKGISLSISAHGLKTSVFDHLDNTTNTVSASTTPNEYHKRTCRRSLSKMIPLIKVDNLMNSRGSEIRELRRKTKNLSGIQVFFSEHLNDDIIKEKKRSYLDLEQKLYPLSLPLHTSY